MGRRSTGDTSCWPASRDFFTAARGLTIGKSLPQSSLIPASMWFGHSGSAKSTARTRSTPSSITCNCRLIPLHLSLPMLDLNFVRDNLPKIEEMLRHRGMDPEVVLKDFRTVDAQRR